MKRIYTIAILSLLTLGAFAQEPVSVQDDSTLVEPFDMPEGMLVGEDDLMNEYTNREGLTPGSATARDISADDALIIQRLSRIPTTIEMPLNNVTRKSIDFYTSGRMRGSVSVMLGAANFYMPIFEEALERYQLPLELKYLPVIESALRPSATSRVGAAGLWQFMIGTAKRYGLEVNTLVDERRDPIKSSEAAAHYLSDLYQMFGDWGLAIAAYNCGEGGIQKAIARAGNTEGADFWTVYNKLPRETRGYVPAFIAANYVMQYYCEHGITPYEATLPAESDTIVVQNEVRMQSVSDICKVSMDELRAINPQYRKDIVPAGYAIRLPSAAIEDFIVYEDSIYGNNANGDLSSSIRRAVTEDLNEEAATKNTSRNRRGGGTSGSRSVNVRKGDTLGAIAKRNGTTVANLRRLNGIRGNNIRAGQKIRVR